MALIFLQSLLIAPLLAIAQNTMNPTILCVPDQCLPGYTNIAFGAKLSSPVSPVPIHLLPGQYTSSTNPKLLHAALISPSTTLTSSTGLTDSLSLPLDLSLRPGLVIFAEHLYSGQISFSSLPSSSSGANISLPLAAKSLALSSDVVAIVNSTHSRVVIWDSVPDLQQLPLSLSQVSLVDIQSTTCDPPCSSAGTCSPDGKCVCLDGFTGSLCEECSPGHFGPDCQKCEDQCERCDEGISGTGRCLRRSRQGNTCNCLSGVCRSDGQCQCTDGFAKADNGTQCAKCADGFFENSTGDCKVCQVGCNQCAPGKGVCLACKSGYSQDPDDPTKCIPPKQVRTSTGGHECPEHSYTSDPLTCSPCDASCESCTGGTSNDCTSCAQGMYMLNGVCVRANGDGICDGKSLFADNVKRACDSCGAKCISCKIPNFSNISVANDLQCTSCIPGTFLSNGKCVDACPSATFVSSQNDRTCQPCDSSCSTCSGSGTFCLSCPGPGRLASNGTCVSASSCPENTFTSSSSSSCLSCHPDCVTCSGSRFDECTSCPATRPVLNGGRCMPTCAKNEYWDSSAGSCRSCDSSCGSCSGPGPSSCLSCSNASDRVLRSGSCVPAAGICTSNTSVIKLLGVCLSELVTVPQARESPETTTTTTSPIPTATGLNQPAKTKGVRRLTWWQFLLMIFGGVFVLLVLVLCCHRWARRRREKRLRLHAPSFANISSTYEPQDPGPLFWDNIPSSQPAYADALPRSQGMGEGDDILSLISCYNTIPRTPPAAKLDFVHHTARSGTKGHR